jgi:hypothetical protein
MQNKTLNILCSLYVSLFPLTGSGFLRVPLNNIMLAKRPAFQSAKTAYSASSTPNKPKLLPCTGHCQQKKSGFIKVLSPIESPNSNQMSYLGAEYNSTNGEIDPCIVRVYSGTDHSGLMQQMLSQLAEKNANGATYLFRLSLKAQGSLNCVCPPFSTYTEKHRTGLYGPERYVFIALKIPSFSNSFLLFYYIFPHFVATDH